MWCWYSNVVIPKHATPSYYKYKAAVPSISASSLPRRRRQDVTTNRQVGELGQTLLANLESNPTPISKAQQQGKQEGEQISGSDVLWALQRASARKNMKMTKKKNKQEHGRDSSSVASRREESAVDYSNVRPLCINDHWAPKLDELEKRLLPPSSGILMQHGQIGIRLCAIMKPQILTFG